MKLKTILLCSAAALFLLAAAGCSEDTEIHRKGITQSELPSAARSFISKNFTNSTKHKIKECQMLTQGKMEWFEVLLVNSDLLTFDKDGQWTILDSLGELPESTLPDGIRKYINDNYNEGTIIKVVFVMKITRTDSGFDVVLNNKENLKFDKAGNKI